MKYVMLKDVCSINMGQSPDSKSYNDRREGLPFFQGNADFGEKYPISRIWCNEPAKIAHAGDILISVRAPIGALNYAKETCCIGRGLAALTPDSSRLSSSFLYWYLHGKTTELNNKGTGSTFKAIGKKVLEETLLPDIGLNQQAVLSGNLEHLYAIIQMRQQQLSKLDELVKARFVKMFGDPIVNCKAWPKQQLSDNVTLLNGRAYQQDELLHSGKYPVLRVGNFFSNREWYYSDLELEDNKYCYKGDLLYAWSASFGPRIWDGDKTIYHYHIWKVVINRGYNKIFLLKLLENMTTALKNETHGIAMMHLTKIGMEQTEFIVPPIELQHQFATFVAQVDKSKAAVQRALDRAQLLFDSLMQKYFG